MDSCGSDSSQARVISDGSLCNHEQTEVPTRESRFPISCGNGFAEWFCICSGDGKDEFLVDTMPEYDKLWIFADSQAVAGDLEFSNADYSDEISFSCGEQFSDGNFSCADGSICAIQQDAKYMDESSVSCVQQVRVVTLVRTCQ